jgi:hypothetical protein
MARPISAGHREGGEQERKRVNSEQIVETRDVEHRDPRIEQHEAEGRRHGGKN